MIGRSFRMNAKVENNSFGSRVDQELELTFACPGLECMTMSRIKFTAVAQQYCHLRKVDRAMS
jgi:hypothetical protein